VNLFEEEFGSGGPSAEKAFRHGFLSLALPCIQHGDEHWLESRYKPRSDRVCFSPFKRFAALFAGMLENQVWQLRHGEWGQATLGSLA
jgi:hypothetical protein